MRRPEQVMSRQLSLLCPQNLLHTEIPGVTYGTCVIDCFFDADASPLTDDCHWSHTCDPLAVSPDYPPGGPMCQYAPGVPISGTGRMALVRRVPKGPVLGISPFNFPLNLVAHKVAPALAVGAPIVVKPAPATPLSDAVADGRAEPELVPQLLDLHLGPGACPDDKLAHPMLAYPGGNRIVRDSTIGPGPANAPRQDQRQNRNQSILHSHLLQEHRTAHTPLPMP